MTMRTHLAFSLVASVALVVIAPTAEADVGDINSHSLEHDSLFAAHGALYAGTFVVDHDAADDGLGKGGLVGFTVRGALGGVPAVAAGVDIELGYGDGELVGQGRIAAGAAALRGPFAASLLLGASIGSLGPAAAADLFAEFSLAAYSRSGVGVWVGLLHAEGLDNIDHERLEIRGFLPSVRFTDLSLYVGARAIWVDHGDNDAALYLFTLGAAFIAST